MDVVRTVAMCVLSVAVVPAEAAADSGGRGAAPTFATVPATLLTTPPVMDGILDDAIWTTPELQTGEWRSYNPLHGDTVPQTTHVWIAYDARYLYFAFQCDDPEPERIKTSVTRRDNIFGDDWVGLSLDALGTGQVSYHMMVNPSGIQLDMLNSASGDEDLAPRLGMGKRGPAQRAGVRGRDTAAAREHPVQRRRVGAHGNPVLETGEPAGRIGVVARTRARQVGFRQARHTDVRSARAASRARGDPVCDVFVGLGSSGQPGLGTNGQSG
jgi:hypothetical protein